MIRFFPNEKVLLNELQKGDEKAYRFLFDTYYKVLFLYAKSLIKEDNDAEDLVQNVFLNLWMNRKTLQIKTSIKSYLYRAVHNIFVNEYQRKLRAENLLHKIHDEVLQKSLKEEEERIITKINWMNQEIERLPPKAKKIFTMNKKRGLTYKEIASMLDISENTVESHIGRTLKRLRKKAKQVEFYLFFF